MPPLDYDFPRTPVQLNILQVDSEGYIHVIEHSPQTVAKYNKLEKNLDTAYFCGQGNPDIMLPFEETKVELIVACKYDGGNIRAEIIEIDEEERRIKVKNLDNYNIVSISESKIFRMIDSFFRVPYRVVKCKLFGLEKLIGMTYIRDAIDEFGIVGNDLKGFNVGELDSIPVLKILPYCKDGPRLERNFKYLSTRIIDWILKKVNPEGNKIQMDGRETQVEITNYGKNGLVWLQDFGQPVAETNLDNILEEHHTILRNALTKICEDYYRERVLVYTRKPEPETDEFVVRGNSVSVPELRKVFPLIEEESMYNELPPSDLKCHINKVRYLSPKNLISKLDNGNGSVSCKVCDISAFLKNRGAPPEIELYGIKNGEKLHINTALNHHEKVQNERISRLLLPPSPLPIPPPEAIGNKSPGLSKPIKLRKWSPVELKAFSKTTKEIEPAIKREENFGEFITTFDSSNMRFSIMQNYWGVDKLADLEKEMLKYYAKDENILKNEYLKVGHYSYYAALVECRWVRVIILNKFEKFDKLDVHLIDHARIRNVDVKDLRFLAYQFYSLPYQSFFGFLIGSRSEQLRILPTRDDFPKVFDDKKESQVVEIVGRNYNPFIGGEMLEFRMRSWTKIN